MINHEEDESVTGTQYIRHCLRPEFSEDLYSQPLDAPNDMALGGMQSCYSDILNDTIITGSTLILDRFLSSREQPEETARRFALRMQVERMDIGQLRAKVLELQQGLDEAETRAERAEDSADFWQRDAMMMQDALHDENFATHRAIGINKAGETMVVALS